MIPLGRSRKAGHDTIAGEMMSAAKKAKKTEVAETTEAPDGKLKNKNYEQELAKLHVELVKLQQWVVHEGLKVCIVFEGRDGAGKGGVIKAITERVSPRVFRVVALPAPTERERSQMPISALHAAPPGCRRDRNIRPKLVPSRPASSVLWASAQRTRRRGSLS